MRSVAVLADEVNGTASDLDGYRSALLLFMRSAN
jgi:hypothetical protein